MNNIKRTQSIHLILFAVQILLVAMLLFVKKSFEFNLGALDGLYMYLVPVLTIVFILVGNYLFSLRMKTATKNNEEHIYCVASLNRLMMIELAALVGMVAYYLSGNLLYLAYTAMILIFFYKLRPNRIKFEQALKWLKKS